MKKIILVGYMGSGKTSVGKLLSKETGIPFFDLDEIIEQNAQKTISELFLEIGEIKFRKLEHDALNDFLITQPEYVLSLGGGTPCYADNHLYLRKDGITSVYLKASVQELVKRLTPEKTQRPLIAAIQEDEFEEFVAKHLFDRNYYYNHAKHVIAVDNKTPQEIVDEIAGILA